MKRYRKKIEEVQAVQISLENAQEIEEITEGHVRVTPEYASLTQGNFAVRDKKGNVEFWSRDSFLYQFEEIDDKEEENLASHDARKKRILDGLREVRRICRTHPISCGQCSIREICHMLDADPCTWKLEDIENAI